jgi:hypothetical protein
MDMIILCTYINFWNMWQMFTKLSMNNAPLEAIPMIHFLFPTNDMVETPVFGTLFKVRKRCVIINAIKTCNICWNNTSTEYEYKKLHGAL